MSFSFKETWQSGVGAKKKCGGYYNSASVTGGTITTSFLSIIERLQLQSHSSATGAYVNLAYTSLPVKGSTGAAIVTASSDTGTWEATGI